MVQLNPDFTLIENGMTLSAAGLPTETAQIIEVAKAGVRGLIPALLSEKEIFIVRDEGVALPSGEAGEVWLQTSGTTGTPKWVTASRSRLMDRIKSGKHTARWLLTFNPGSFAGIQVILSAISGGHTLVVPAYGAGITEMADLAVAENVTHISATPTFWRAFLMALGERSLPLKGVTLGGEAADQTLLDTLKERFPFASLRHIYATTEAGTVFSVNDGRAGFPHDWLTGGIAVTNQNILTVKGLETGDVVEIVGDRVLFRGRADAMINVGGIKVYPETVESYLLQLPFIREVRISARPNPITGHVLVADIVLKENFDRAEADIKAHLQALPRAHRPVRVHFVDCIDVAATGKKSRLS